MDHLPSNDFPNLYDEDIVYLKGRNSVFGIVEKLGWDNSDDELSSDEEIEDPIDEDKILVFWTHLGINNAEDPNDLELLDRSFIHGDIVSPLNDSQGPIGTVKDIYLFADVQFIQSNEILYNVPTVFLANVVPCIVGDFAIYKNWIGNVEECIYSLNIEFKDGSKCTLHQKSSEPTLESIDINSNRSAPFFPGQRVKSKDKSQAWNNAIFIHGKSNPKNQKEGLVIDVEYIAVEISWITFFVASSDDAQLTIPPQTTISPKELTFLKHFKNSCWEVGEHCYIHPSLKDKYQKKKNINWNDDVNKNHTDFRLKNDMARMASTLNVYSSPNEQDNHKSSKSAKGKRGLKQKKQKKLNQPKNCAQIIRTKTFIDVQLQDGSILRKVEAKDFVPRRTMENDFCPGDFVISNEEEQKGFGWVKMCNYKERTCVIKWIDQDIEEECSVYNIQHNLDFPFTLGSVIASCNYFDKGNNIGQINSIEDGKIGVIWIDDSITYENPLGLLIIEDEDVYHRHMDIIAEQILSGYFTEEEEGFEEEEQEDFNDEECEDSFDNVEGEKAESSHDEEVVHQTVEDSNNALEVNEINFPNDTADSNQDIETNFFSIPNVPATHHFYEQPHSTSRAFVSRVMNEWNILSTSLPTKGIWVAAYEDRIDLLTVMMEGIADTPYYINLFEFDIYLPIAYPSEAPMVFFRSRVPKFNPNLNEDGSVCLSLLGTWFGKGVEVWNPDHSNLLQLIVSIQGLILGTNEPYYLEAGYDKQKGTQSGAYNSKMYNERALLHSLQMMSKIMRYPMADFEKTVQNHFNHSKNDIIEMIETLLASKDKEDSSELIKTKFGVPLQPKPSLGFLLSLQKIYPIIKESFDVLKGN